MTTPLPIAVVIPCFNDGATVEEAIASVLDDAPAEVVVVDDGSTDAGTRSALERVATSGVMVIRQDNAGVSAARMRGVKATTSPYVLALDADDRIAPGALRRMLAALEDAPDLDLVWGDIEQFVAGGYRLYPKARTLDPWRITFLNELVASTLIRRSALVSAGGWQLGGLFEDWDLWMSLAERGMRGRHVGGVTLLYRVEDGRGYAAGLARQDEIGLLLAERHRMLFAARATNRKHADAGILLRWAWTLIALIGLPPRFARFGYMGALMICEPARRRRRSAPRAS